MSGLFVVNCSGGMGRGVEGMSKLTQQDCKIEGHMERNDIFMENVSCSDMCEI